MKKRPGRRGVELRDAMVIDACVRRGVPVVMTLGGGYSKQAWEVQYASVMRTLERHGGVQKGGDGEKGRLTARKGLASLKLRMA
jgi:hypothetical protein